MGTRIGICVKCEKEAEIAARGLCYGCYRSEERAIVGRDRHSGALRRDHDKLFTAHTEMMRAMRRSGVNREDVRKILGIMQPYWQPIWAYLRDSVPSDEVNEQSVKVFTVHPGGDAA